jgi:hypothetical protein
VVSSVWPSTVSFYLPTPSVTGKTAWSGEELLENRRELERILGKEEGGEGEEVHMSKDQMAGRPEPKQQLKRITNMSDFVQAVVTVQRLVRGRNARRSYHTHSKKYRVAQRDAAAVKLQAAARGKQGRDAARARADKLEVREDFKSGVITRHRTNTARGRDYFHDR